jgi:hypothetical protein
VRREMSVPTLFAQSLGEYGAAGGLFGGLANAISGASNWVQLSLREDRSMWIAGAGCALVLYWFFNRR